MPSSWLLAARLQDGREGSAVLLYVVAKGHKHFLPPALGAISVASIFDFA